MSGELSWSSNHPQHLTKSRSYALIPFCAYKTDLNFSKSNIELPGVSFPVCSSFLPTILEGQLCYKLTLNKTSGQGKRNELMMLLDYNDDLSIQTFPNETEDAKGSRKTLNFDMAVESLQVNSAKIHIDTLTPYTGFSGGIYKMTDVKKMSATSDFLKMPLKDRKCEPESYENCRTKRLVEECNCVPWEVPGFQVETSPYYIALFLQGGKTCGLEGRDCVERNYSRVFNCNTTCNGIYADVDKIEGLLTQDDNKTRKDASTKKFQRLIEEYRTFKKNYVQHFRFSSASNKTVFGGFKNS